MSTGLEHKSGKSPFVLLHLSRKFLLIVLFACAFLGWAPAASAQSTASVQSNQQLFAVMCALHAAGYDAEVGAANLHPLRAQLRGELLQLHGPATEALRAYYREHRQGDPTADLSRYISFALVVGPPPRFEFLYKREALPTDVLGMEGFNEILAAFYQEAQIEKLWQRAQPYYEPEIRRLREPVGQVVLVATSYLREVDRPFRGRSFAVYVEPMVGGKVNFRSFGDRYSVVLSPSTDVSVDDIRHAFLHFLLDPLPYRYPRSVETRSVLLRYAGSAARLPPEFRDDFPALMTECLVRAVELRLRRLAPAQAAAAIDEAEGDGYILVRALYAGLARFEQSEPAMSFYFPDLMAGIDVMAEARRLERVTFAEERPRETRAAHRSESSELESWLREGEVRIASQDGEGAASWFEKVLAKYPDYPRALYGLAVSRILLKQGDQAKELFLHIIALAKNPAGGAAQVPDGVVLAWSHVYLGRIYDVEGNRELALTEYRAALAVDGAPETARMAAKRGIDKGFAPARPAPDAGQPRP